MTQLTPHFALSEFTRSAKAQALGINNTPPNELIPNLIRTAEMLERIRATLAKPITITSGYRCPALNIKVGGVTSSDHTRGQSADIVCPGFGSPYDVAVLLAPLVSTLGIGQLIYEGVRGKRWVHVSTQVPPKLLNRIITITDSGAVVGIQKID